MTNLFGPSNKVVYLKKLVFQSAVRFLILFVLMDAILLKLDLQKRTNDLDNPPNGKLFVYQKCIICPKIGRVFLIFIIKLPLDSVLREHFMIHRVFEVVQTMIFHTSIDHSALIFTPFFLIAVDSSIYSSHYVKRQIEELGLLVKLAFVGPNSQK